MFEKLKAAAESGDLPALKQLELDLKKAHDNQYFGVRTDVVPWAVRTGQISVLDWAVEDKELGPNFEELSVFDEILKNAVISGQPTVLNWLKQNSTQTFNANIGEIPLMRRAAELPNLEVIKWLDENSRSPVDLSFGGDMLLRMTAGYGQLDAVKWLMGKMEPDDLMAGTEALTSAVSLKQVAVAKWLLSEPGVAVDLREVISRTRMDRHDNPAIDCLDKAEEFEQSHGSFWKEAYMASEKLKEAAEKKTTVARRL